MRIFIVNSVNDLDKGNQEHALQANSETIDGLTKNQTKEHQKCPPLNSSAT